MKKLISLLTALLIYGASFAQNPNNNPQWFTKTGLFSTTGTIDPSAVFELRDTERGFLAPRMTEVERDAIGSPATGLLIYQTDGTTGFYYYTGSVWAHVGSSGGIGGDLNAAYDYGGAGAGRTITADAGAVQINGNFNTNFNSTYLINDSLDFFGLFTIPYAGFHKELGSGIITNGFIGPAPFLANSATIGWLESTGISNRIQVQDSTEIDIYSPEFAVISADDAASPTIYYEMLTNSTESSLHAFSASTDKYVKGSAYLNNFTIDAYDDDGTTGANYNFTKTAFYLNNSDNTGTTPYLISGTDQSETDVAGNDLIIRSSAGNGTGADGSLLLQVANTPYLTIGDGGIINLPSLPAYDDDAAAGGGGLSAGDLYQTTGSGSAPLNAAGIVMIKQ